jgi:protein-disulfide isomerase
LSSIHKDSIKAAAAAVCAESQGKFWEYHDLLFGNQQDLSRVALGRYAQRIGINPEQFEACMDSEATRKRLYTDRAFGERLGLNSTPTFFVNGRLTSGSSLEDIVADELKVAAP